MAKLLFFVIFIIKNLFLSSASTSGTKAYCTYHHFAIMDKLTTVACSNGANGIITKMKYTDISKMFPYVAAWDQAHWNSPNCGSCIKVTDSKNTRSSIFVTVIDQCEPNKGSGSDTHLDISKEAYRVLFGEDGIKRGINFASWKVVTSNKCKGNIKNSNNLSSSNVVIDNSTNSTTSNNDTNNNNSISRNLTYLN